MYWDICQAIDHVGQKKAHKFRYWATTLCICTLIFNHRILFVKGFFYMYLIFSFCMYKSKYIPKLLFMNAREGGLIVTVMKCF